MKYLFGSFELDTAANTISFEGTEIAVEPKVYTVLLFLIENRERMISRDELLDHCWPGVYVSDGTLSRCLSRIRKVLRQPRNADSPIHTVHSKGYRFVAELNSIEGEIKAEDSVDEEESSDASSTKRFLSVLRVQLHPLDDEETDFHEREFAFADTAALIADSFDCEISEIIGDEFIVRIGQTKVLERPVQTAIAVAKAMQQAAKRAGIGASAAITSGVATVNNTGTSLALVGVNPMRGDLIPHEILLDKTSLEDLGEGLTFQTVGGAFKLDSGVADLEFESHFLGRKAELFQLEEIWAAVKPGRAQIVSVTGEPGIGKTVLVQEFLRQNSDDIEAHATLRCSQTGLHTPFHSFLDFLSEELGIDGTTPPVVVLQRVERLLETSGQLATYHLPLLASFLGVARGEKSLDQLSISPGQRRDMTLEALASIFVGWFDTRTSLIWIDDAQWLDRASIDLLNKMVETDHDTKLMIILCEREFNTALKDAREISIGRMTQQQCLRLLSQMDEDIHIPSNQIKMIAERSEGVPLFLKEIVRMSRLTADDNGPASGGVPRSLQGLLYARLLGIGDHLQFAQWASMVGRSFNAVFVAKLMGMDADRLKETLSALTHADILRKARGSDVSQYDFTHALLRDAAYETMSLEERHERHLSVAIAMEKTDIATRDPARIALQFSASTEPGRAARYWKAAGENSMENSALSETQFLFRQALAAAKIDSDMGNLADELEDILSVL